MKICQWLVTIIIILQMSKGAAAQINTAIISVGSTQKPIANEAVATFASGCFWHTEIIFQSLVGVRDAVSGYAGGQTPNPSYEAVNSGSTGHAECVQVFYNPQQISFQQLVKAYFASIDPTTLNRQGNDIGTQYRTIVFYNNDVEKNSIVNEMKMLVQSKKYNKPIVTTLMPFTTFYEAEPYHQEFAFNNPNNRYVQSVAVPELRSFMKNFKGQFKVKIK
ncbi:peptide-methionine (S)-S-oxide reductase MsrA [Ferruginibacter yonginensis]|uniref:Peptide methionine sulfoxide reductase MsrA n=1 Tax=Ferruginibacter yonginensis TaxID=1310416 RepID=A0ABV8QMH1_9BACT